MKKYEKVYNFSVLGEVEKGEDVYMINRRTKTIAYVNQMLVASLMLVINDKNSDNGIEFYKEVTVNG